MTKIKICGITNLDDALCAQDAGADIIGFIFAESPRRIEPAAAKKIIEKLSDKIEISALFVNEDEKRVDKVISEIGRLDYIQLHGDEPPEYCRQFNGANIIKAFRIQDEESVFAIGAYKDFIRFVLLDAFSGSQYGGTGKTFDWSHALRAKLFDIPLFLAGGLNPDNVSEAVKKVRPYGVDVTSGVEASPGKKDHDLLRKFIKNVRSV